MTKFHYSFLVLNMDYLLVKYINYSNVEFFYLEKKLFWLLIQAASESKQCLFFIITYPTVLGMENRKIKDENLCSLPITKFSLKKIFLSV